MKQIRFFQRKRLASKPAAKIFSTKPVYKPRLFLLRVVEIVIVTFVVLGTVALVFFYQRNNLASLVKQIGTVFTPKSAPKQETKTSFEDELTNRLAKSKIESQTLTKTEEGNYSLLLNKIKISFSSSKDPDRQVSTLQTLLAKAKIDGKAIKKIDFRFENLVVEYR